MNTKLKSMAFAAALIFAGGFLAACGGDDETKPNPPPPPPPPPSSVNFTAFVHTLLQQPGSSTPAVLNGVDFSFPDLNNPKAYCDILPPSDTGPCAGAG